MNYSIHLTRTQQNNLHITKYHHQHSLLIPIRHSTGTIHHGKRKPLHWTATQPNAFLAAGIINWTYNYATTEPSTPLHANTYSPDLSHQKHFSVCLKNNSESTILNLSKLFNHYWKKDSHESVDHIHMTWRNFKWDMDQKNKKLRPFLLP